MDELPFRIALVGDFGARAHRAAGGGALEQRRTRRVDRDSLDDALARIAPEVRLSGGGDGEARVSPRTMDDFTPDRLAEALPAFRDLAAARERVASQASFARTVARIRTEAETGAQPPAAAAGTENAETLGLLERIVDAATYSPEPSSVAVNRDAELERLIRRIVAPHLVTEPDAMQRAALAEIDRAVAARLRAVLHDPELQALESRWRTVERLVRRLDTDDRLQLHLVDAHAAELAADLAAHEDPEQTAIVKLLRGTGDGSWGVVIALFALDASAEDARFAADLARLGQAVGAPVIADARPALVGASTFAETLDVDEWDPAPVAAWEELRRSPAARWLGLAAPRVLLRLPYGKDGEPCERLAFEELETKARAPHDHHLWGSAAACCALLLGEAWSEDGWSLRPRPEVGGLPLVVRREDGETSLLPCSEGIMTERAASRMLERGIMPVAWLRDTDAVRVVRFQSIATPNASLAGRWSRTS